MSSRRCGGMPYCWSHASAQPLRAAGLLFQAGPHLLHLVGRDGDARVLGGPLQHTVENHAVQGVAGEGAGLGEGLRVLRVVGEGGALGGADLLHPALQLRDGDPLPADDGRRAGMRVVPAGGQKRGRRDHGGQQERGAATAVQGNLPRRLCDGAQSLAVIDGRQWRARGQPIRPTIHQDFGHRRPPAARSSVRALSPACPPRARPRPRRPRAGRRPWRPCARSRSRAWRRPPGRSRPSCAAAPSPGRGDLGVSVGQDDVAGTLEEAVEEGARVAGALFAGHLRVAHARACVFRDASRMPCGTVAVARRACTASRRRPLPRRRSSSPPPPPVPGECDQPTMATGASHASRSTVIV